VDWHKGFMKAGFVPVLLRSGTVATREEAEKLEKEYQEKVDELARRGVKFHMAWMTLTTRRRL